MTHGFFSTSRVNSSTCRVDFSTCRVNSSRCRVNLSRCRVDLSKCRVDLSRCRVDLSRCRIIFTESDFVFTRWDFVNFFPVWLLCQADKKYGILSGMWRSCWCGLTPSLFSSFITYCSSFTPNNASIPIYIEKRMWKETSSTPLQFQL